MIFPQYRNKENISKYLLHFNRFMGVPGMAVSTPMPPMPSLILRACLHLPVGADPPRVDLAGLEKTD